MKIQPVSNILIRGEHCPRGVVVEVSEADGWSLISQGLAVRDTAQAPVVETAEAKPAVETAARATIRTRRAMTVTP